MLIFSELKRSHISLRQTLTRNSSRQLEKRDKSILFQEQFPCFLYVVADFPFNFLSIN